MTDTSTIHRENIDFQPREHVDPMEATNVSEADGQMEQLSYPKAIFFIVSNSSLESFNYYGMRTIMVLYLSQQLNYGDNTTTIIFHTFTMFVYFVCILGAIISDSWLGKYKTILYMSLIYVCGSVLVTLGAIPPLNLPVKTFTLIGLVLIGLCSGSLKPCVSPFGGDQFKLPEQKKQLTTFFSWFYFCIQFAALIATTLTPILRADIQCFGGNQCYSLGFGVPAIAMILSIVIFLLGRSFYKSISPSGNMVVLVSKTIVSALKTKWKESNTNTSPCQHWLDYANRNYDHQLIEDIKVLMRFIVLYLPIPVFWALCDQQGSRWIFQATRMDGDMGSWKILPDQMEMLNRLLILIFVPLCEIALYPALRLIGIGRPLQKMTMASILAIIAFIISGVVEINLEKTYPVTPSAGYIQLRVFNGIPNCSYTVESNLPNYELISCNGLNMGFDKFIDIRNKSISMSYSISNEEDEEGCPKLPDGIFTFEEELSYSIFLQDKNTSQPVYIYAEQMEKSSKGYALVRNLANINASSYVIWKSSKTGTIGSTKKSYDRKIIELTPDLYDVFIDDVKVRTVDLRYGGVYNLLVGIDSDSNEIISKLVEIIVPNSMNMLWLIPQFFIMTLGEVIFSVTGLEFSYSQAPISMKSVMHSCWLLTVAFGNVIIVVEAELHLFQSEAYEFFFFAALMFVDVIVFMWLAYRYKPHNPMLSESREYFIFEEPKNANENELKGHHIS